MNQGTYQLAASMINQLNRVDNISNNLANANTSGFKEERLVEGSFNNYLKRANEEGTPIDKRSEIYNKIPKLDGKYTISDLGSIQATGNRLDFALNEPDMFFKVKDANNQELLTRDGTFHIVDNKLVTKDGYEVLDENGNSIDTTEEGFENLLSVVKTNYSNIEKLGNNNYNIKDTNGVVEVENKEEHILQGSLEKSNVNSVHTMVSLIDAQRRFEQAQKAIKSIDDINSKVIDKLGQTQ